jgi:hypothetical protein
MSAPEGKTDSAAEYKRTETKFLVPHTGDAVCTVCGGRSVKHLRFESDFDGPHDP